MTIQAQLPAPVDLRRLGHEDARVRAGAGPQRGDGPAGYAYTLTRDGAVAEQIRKTIAPPTSDTAVDDREATFTLAWRRSLASHAAGIGLRALSIVDLACWDLAARLARPLHRRPARGSQRRDASHRHHRLPAGHDGTRGDRRPDRRAVRRRAGGASRLRPAARRNAPPRACARREPPRPMPGWAWTRPGSTTTSTPRPTS